MTKILPKIFVSYNPGSTFEETLAIRLHTIGSVHGFDMLLPDRYNNHEIVSPETRSRILLSKYFIIFSTSIKLSKEVEAEIVTAYNKLKDKSRIIIIYDAHKGKNLRGTDNCTEIFIDTKKQKAQEIVVSILEEIKLQQRKNKAINRSKTIRQENSSDAIGGILLAGLGLLLLGALLNNKK